MAQGGRKTQLPLIHELSVQVTPAMGTGGLIGVLPAGSILGTVHTLIAQAFNSTTNTGGVGFAAPPAGPNLQGGIDLKTPVRGDAITPVAQAGPFPVDTPLYWSALFTGAAPTTGLVVWWFDYLPGAG